MRYAPVVALSVVMFASGGALAQEALGSIEVKAEDSERTITIACSDPSEPSLKEVEQVLILACGTSYYAVQGPARQVDGRRRRSLHAESPEDPGHPLGLGLADLETAAVTRRRGQRPT